MKRTIAIFAAIALSVSLGALADDAAKPAKPATQVAKATDAQTKTLPPVTSADKHNGNSLSSTIERGIDNQGLTMEEKWSDEVIVCKKQKVTGSRIVKKVCHSRGEWRAIRENSRELTRQVQRRDSGLDEQ